MANPPRSTRNQNPSSFPEGFDALISPGEDKALTPKSNLDEFRRFFDLKENSWREFRARVKAHALLSSSWADIQESERKREAVAAIFLEQVGPEYWGKETRDKYLLEDHIRNGNVCDYPRDKKRMIKALSFLLEKDSKTGTKTGFKTKRESSVLRDVSEIELDSPLPDPPASDEINGPIKRSSGRASTPTGLFRIPRTPKTPQTPRPMRSTSVVRAEGSPHSSAPSTPTPLTRGGLDAVENALVSSALATRGDPSQEDTQLCCQESTGGAENLQFPDIPPNTLATYFLVQEHGSQREPVCVPFRNFEDYNTTDEFLDEMEKRCCCEHEPSMLQLFEEVRQFSHAVVLLQWSGVSFVMRRETDDLQSLANRIGCAWRAKGEGELQTFEFVIRVTLKKD
ncbi:uncharacterized protein N7496_009515 [Penicillium cataractarum]|uniref:Uncharacterized protein n=1 Tax=Penicillium cataractarum TaxID=2100454 RepID=A0A9W9RP80_9EURO|nr:uncharacterized protein N7496_009515 [Penicillium cataractarum]KAJ5363802.1 hypothetical protein N7496_009515 [Penicillium cataractarum]